MTFPSGILTEENLADVIGEVWSPRINDIFRANLQAGNFFLDLSDEMAEGGDTLHIPNFQTLGTDARGTETVTIPLQAFDMDETNLSVATEKVSAVAISRREAIQMLNRYGMQERLINGLAYAIRKDLDTAILGLYSGIGAGYTVNDSDAAVEDADILEAIGLLAKGDIPLEECAFFFYPTIVWGDLMGIAKYYDASSLGISPGPVAKRPAANSPVGYLYGIPVFTTTQVPITSTTHVHNLLAHREAFAYALQGGVDLRSTWEHSYNANLISASSLYGVIENRAGAAVEISAVT